MLFLKPATGSWRQAITLTASFTGMGIVLYTANEYLWDKLYAPKPANADGEFDLVDHVS